MTNKQFIKINGDYSNNTDYWLYVFGFSGTYSIKDSNGTTIGTLLSVIPCGVIPPNFSLEGGTNFYGILIKFEDIRL